MKKRLIQLALILGLMTLTCVAAQAAESESASGFRNIKVEDAYRNDVVLTALDASSPGRTVKPSGSDDTVFPGAVKLGVTYKNAQSGSQYLLIVLSDDNATPSVDNMAYIDQQPASSNTIDFEAFPKKVDAKTSSVTYSVYLSSDTDASSGNGVTTYVKVGSVEYYDNNALNQGDVTLGDVDDDGTIAVGDAVMVLRAVVQDVTLDAKQTAAADVNGDGSVAVGDAVGILRYVVQDIKSFDELRS